MTRTIAILALVIGLAAGISYAMIAERPAGEPISQSDAWPAGLADALNSRARVYAYGSTYQDFFFYTGDLRALNAFLIEMSKVKGVPITLAYHTGRGSADRIDGKKTYLFDWSVTGNTLDWNAEAASRLGRPRSIAIDAYLPAKDRPIVIVPQGIRVMGTATEEPVDSTGKDTRLAIYLLADAKLTTRGVEKKPLDELALRARPLYTLDDLASYDWSDHTFTLTPDAQQRMPHPPVFGTPFVVVAEGKRVCLGSFYTIVSSYLPDCPYVTVERLEPEDPAYHVSPAPGRKADELNALLVKQILDSAHKLKS